MSRPESRPPDLSRHRLASFRVLAPLLVVALLGVGASAARAAGSDPTQRQADAQVGFERVASGLIWPVDIQTAGDEDLYIVERRGTIRVMSPDGVLRSEPFLDIRDRVDQTGIEMGLLGLAFHPDYATTGELIVNYTAGNPRRTVVSRFTVPRLAGVLGDEADPASEEVILEFPQPGENHNGGQLAFGPDGYLYVATGDGGPEPREAQSPQSVLGGVLRIDIDSSVAGRSPDCTIGPANAYRIPTDNPVAAAGECGEIWLSGLRNPWRMSFDSATGDLWLADVGEDHREELNVQRASQPPGLNFGWPCFEGTLSNPGPGCQAATEFAAPIFEYLHDGVRCSVTGGHVYRGAQIPQLFGQYIFGDYCSSEYWAASVSGAGAGDPEQDFLPNLIKPPGAFPVEPTTFGRDAVGEMYVATVSGGIWRIVDARPDPAPTSTPVPTVIPTPRPTPVTVRPSIDLSSSCLAGSGRVDVLVRNQTATTATFTVEVGSLSPRIRTVAPDGEATVTVTGRADGQEQIIVRRDGALVGLRTATIACKPAPQAEVAIHTDCFAGKGRVEVRLHHARVDPITYVVEVDGLERTRVVAADEVGRAVVTGRSDGPVQVSVRRDGVLIALRVPTIACG